MVPTDRPRRKGVAAENERSERVTEMTGSLRWRYAETSPQAPHKPAALVRARAAAACNQAWYLVSGGAAAGVPAPVSSRPSRDERAVAIGIEDPDIPHQRAVRVAIGRLPFQPDLLALDQGRIGGRRFGGEAGIASWRLQPQISHCLLLAADLDGEARAIEDVDNSGLEQRRRCGRGRFAQGQRGPRSIEV